MGDVFLSYRRDDASSATGRLSDHLQATLGGDRVFRDLHAIAPGDDFPAALRRAIGGARVLIVVIGPRWLAAADAQGRRRLQQPHDMVRQEIEAAFACRVPVLPVTVDGARMPSAHELPPSLAALAQIQAVTLEDRHWQADAKSLLQALHQRYGVESSAPGAARAVTSPRLLLEALELLARPRRVMLRLAGDAGLQELQRSLLLLVLWLAAGNALVGSVVDPADIAGTVLNGVVLGLLATAASVPLVALGWRLAGAQAGWQRTSIGTACLAAGACAYGAIGLFLFALGLAMSDRSIFDAVRAAAVGGLPPLHEFESLAQARMRGPALAGFVLASGVWLGGIFWLAAAWRALCLALGRPGWAGWFAAAAVLGALWAIVGLVGWAVASL